MLCRTHICHVVTEVAPGGHCVRQDSPDKVRSSLRELNFDLRSGRERLTTNASRACGTVAKDEVIAEAPPAESPDVPFALLTSEPGTRRDTIMIKISDSGFRTYQQKYQTHGVRHSQKTKLPEGKRKPFDAK